ncbi:hypothetical protein SAMN05444678_109131 [Sphingomonas sp. YR710]|nr:hypothetical protein SAMN05444678_109131 [Sphingomonas sp. YR710]
MKQLHMWHWMSAAISLIGMAGFAATGITLNHAESIDAKPAVIGRGGQLPAPLLHMLAPRPASDKAALPAPVAAHLARAIGLDPAGKPGEWSDADVYVALPRPGGDAWVSIDRHSGAITAERTDRGWISYLNDLHKGRNTGAAWQWFIDLFAAACIIFTTTGLLLLQILAKNRRLTWPLVGLGLAAPLLVIILFIH